MSLEALSSGVTNSIKYLVTDCDGVLTDGKYYTSKRGKQLITFSALDSLAIGLIKESDLKFIVISSTTDARIISNRCDKWGVRFVRAAPWHKLEVLGGLVNFERTAYIGDSLDDVQVFEQVKLAFTPANSFVQSYADYILSRNSGEGCLLETFLSLRHRDEDWKDFRLE